MSCVALSCLDFRWNLRYLISEFCSWWLSLSFEFRLCFQYCSFLRFLYWKALPGQGFVFEPFCSCMISYCGVVGVHGFFSVGWVCVCACKCVRVFVVALTQSWSGCVWCCSVCVLQLGAWVVCVSLIVYSLGFWPIHVRLCRMLPEVCLAAWCLACVCLLCCFSAQCASLRKRIAALQTFPKAHDFVCDSMQCIACESVGNFYA